MDAINETLLWCLSIFERQGVLTLLVRLCQPPLTLYFLNTWQWNMKITVPRISWISPFRSTCVMEKKVLSIKLCISSTVIIWHWIPLSLYTLYAFHLSKTHPLVFWPNCALCQESQLKSMGNAPSPDCGHSAPCQCSRLLSSLSCLWGFVSTLAWHH